MFLLRIIPLHWPIPSVFFTLRKPEISALMPIGLRLEPPASAVAERCAPAALSTSRSDIPGGLPMTSDSGPERKFWQIAVADLERQLDAGRNASAPPRPPRAGSAMALTRWRSGGVCLCRSNFSAGSATRS